MRRLRRVFCLAASVTSLGWMSCSPSMELPEVKTRLATDLGCPPHAYGTVVRPVWIELSDGTSLLECAITEFGACRPGRIRYDVTVGRGGELLAISVTGDAPPSVKSCVEAHLREAVLTPAADCRDEPLPSALDGDVRWGPDVGLQGSHSGVLGAAWPCAPGGR